MTDTTVHITSHRKERETEIKNSLQKSLERVGLIVERQAKINVTQSPPKHPQVQTGRLRSSITHVVSEGEVAIGTNVEYGRELEEGTIHHPPYPWLYPAVELKRDEIKEAFKGKEFGVSAGD